MRAQFLFIASVLASLSVLSFSNTSFAQLTNVGTLGGTNSYAYALSSNGAVIAGNSETAGGIIHAFRWVNGVMTDLGNLGGSYSGASALSADGSVVAGYAQTALGSGHAFRWMGGVMTDLGTLGGTSSNAFALSADGTVVAGESTTAGGHTHAFRWVNGAMTDLGTLGGTTSNVSGLSADGTVVAGYSDTAGNAANHAFRWVNGVMTDLGTLGGLFSYTFALSSDGEVVAGQSHTAGNVDTHAFRWVGGVMTDLGTLGGTYSSAYALSADGSVVAGQAQTASLEDHAFRWVGGVMTDLGTLGGVASYVSAISADGAVITGSSTNITNNRSLYYRWTQAGGMQSLESLLTAAGVDFTGWLLDSDGFSYESKISADGKVIAGTGIYNGTASAFIFNMAGLITPEELAQSLIPTTAPAQQVMAGMQGTNMQNLMIARNAISTYFKPQTFSTPQRLSTNTSPQNIEPAAGENTEPSPQQRLKKQKALYITGSFGAGQNDNFSSYNSTGSTGALVQVSNSLALGAGIIGSYNREETRLKGNSLATSAGLALMASYEAPSGFNIYATTSAASLNVSTNRHYINGATVDGSKGDTDGMGYAGAVRLGYDTKIKADTSITPYLELDASHTSLDAYTEIGGGFPATINAQSENFVASRLGGEVSHTLSPSVTMRGRAAWGHRYTSGGATVATASAITQTIPGDAGERNWAEGGVTLNYAMTDKTTFTADLSGRAGKTSEPAVNLTLGLVWALN